MICFANNINWDVYKPTENHHNNNALVIDFLFLEVNQVYDLIFNHMNKYMLFISYMMPK